ncbi:MAG: zinc-dependent alcohol dehydrogenase family protein [Syntrophobacterales bacterium]|jgi:propanol-preferring alcohol dehydrogenase|nr:zinc-dependent alcohol dehydrogenase family protein [Syntrophobacterales bacterium]
MKALILTKVTSLHDNPAPLEWMEDWPIPVPGPKDILVKVLACGVCHTELDEIEGRTPPSFFPMILGHQIVGQVADAGENSRRFKRGDRVGVGWFHSACGTCVFCRTGRENLCPSFKATGRDACGGYAEYTTIPEDSAFLIPETISHAEASPLLCAGAIGYRSLCLTQLENGQNLGLTGFGASAHLTLKLARFLYPASPVFVFARNEKEREFARELGAVWAGDTEETAPEKLHGIIDTTPVWKPVLEALKNLERGGRLVINAIRKEEKDKDLLAHLNYSDQIWMEKEIKSVANVTRKDIEEFLHIAADINIRPAVEEYPLKEANTALRHLKQGNIVGAKVLVP